MVSFSTKNKYKIEKKKERDALRREKKKLKKLEKLNLLKQKMEKKMLVAVYGSLKQGLHNHKCLENADYVGSFVSEPIFNLFDLGTFPGLTENGDTAVHMEVYEINEDTLARLDTLEGYAGAHLKNHNYYNREEIKTPYGEAFVYFYNYATENCKKVTQSDWKDYIESKKLRQAVLNN